MAAPKPDAKPKKEAFVKNADLLREIHRSKVSYCSFLEPWHAAPDVIVQSFKEITPELTLEVRTKKAKPFRGTKVEVETILPETIVYRVMTYEHIPEDLTNTKPRGEARLKAKVTFPPFKHYLMLSDGPVEVCRSHWVGGFENGHFSADHGKVTDKLGEYIWMMCNKYGQRGNWRGYSYVDEMVGKAVVQLIQVGLQFDEGRGDVPNPFAYYTTTMSNIFKRVWNAENDQQQLRDDLLECAGASPSHTRQNANQKDNFVSAPGKSLTMTPELEAWLKERGHI